MYFFCAKEIVLLERKLSLNLPTVGVGWNTSNLATQIVEGNRKGT
jgi:hypothetical protein